MKEIRKKQPPSMQYYIQSSWINSDSPKGDFRKNLLSWFDQQQRDLPWRKNPSLYKTVVSEFMLQQTRVSTVLPYFANWLHLFPDFHALASASEKSVLKAWEGLGYYTRARNLHKLAQVAENWKEPPACIEEWKKLPGVGPYISAAVTSISLNQPNAVCDGNVVRVLSRLFSVSEVFRDGATAQKKLLPVAQKLLCKDRPGDFNQAMMELGATVCHRRSPHCTLCPVISLCKSGSQGDFSQYPKIQRKEKKKRQIKRYWVEQDDSILLHVSDAGRMRGIYELPSSLPDWPNQHSSKPELMINKKRTIGNVDYLENIYLIRTKISTSQSLTVGYEWVKWSDLNNFTISGPHRKWIREIRELAFPQIREDQRNKRQE